jgi:lipoprotein-anchoring transpeptidase ErfK/SrfK
MTFPRSRRAAIAALAALAALPHAALAQTPAAPAATPPKVEYRLVAEPVAVATAATAELPASIPDSTGAPATAPAAAVPQPKPETTLLIDIDLTRQKMTVSERGVVVGSWPVSSGTAEFRSPTGTFRPLWMSKMWYSKKYDNAPMPHAVFFSGGVAMHATQATGLLGRPASHGCIRQSPANAATTYRLVAKHGNAHTKIVVHGTPRYSETKIARRDHPSRDSRFAPAGNRFAMAQSSMRRVILVDGNGNRRIADIPANDPRLVAYQRRIQPLAPASRPYYTQGGYYGRSAW